MLIFYARFVPGFSPSFGVCPAFIGLAESEGFEPPGHRMRYRGDKQIFTLSISNCLSNSYLQYNIYSFWAYKRVECPIYARFSIRYYIYAHTQQVYACMREVSCA